MIVLPASPESPPVADTLKPSTYRVRAPAAADGAAIVTAGVVTGAAATIGKGVDATGAGSSLVLASTVRLPTVGGLTIPRRVASRRSPALTVPLLNSVQVVTWMFGAAQLPTSTPRVTSRNVPPFHGPRPESPGSWIRTVSLPLSGAPTVSPTRYTVRARGRGGRGGVVDRDVRDLRGRRSGEQQEQQERERGEAHHMPTLTAVRRAGATPF